MVYMCISNSPRCTIDTIRRRHHPTIFKSDPAPDNLMRENFPRHFPKQIRQRCDVSIDINSNKALVAYQVLLEKYFSAACHHVCDVWYLPIPTTEKILHFLARWLLNNGLRNRRRTNNLTYEQTISVTSSSLSGLFPNRLPNQIQLNRYHQFTRPTQLLQVSVTELVVNTQINIKGTQGGPWQKPRIRDSPVDRSS